MKSVLYFFSALLMGTSANAVTMDITEVSIGDFSEFVSSSGLITRVEQHGGMVYESGWVVKPNWPPVSIEKNASHLQLEPIIYKRSEWTSGFIFFCFQKNLDVPQTCFNLIHTGA